MNTKANRVVREILGEAWQPKKSDIEWLQQLTQSMNHNGVWAVPQNGQVYQFDQENKTITLISGAVDFIFHRTQAIALKIGWRVLRKGDDNPEHITVTEGGGPPPPQ